MGYWIGWYSENFEKRGNPVIKEYCRRKGKDNADNLTVKDITKAHAIDCLLKYLGISIEDTIAFGDAKIDIPMLEYCNIGVAMGSGGEEIKAMADYVTDDVDNDGLYKAFVHFGLIEK